MFERVAPKTLKLWLILAALVYLLLPYDLLPDFLGVPGRIDDLLLMAWFAWFYRDHLRRYAGGRTGAGPSAGTRGDSQQGGGARETPPRARSDADFDPYEVLGIPRSAPREAIRAAYRERMNEYHPDKVAHLGEELQRLAHEKSQEIQRAYRDLK